MAGASATSMGGLGLSAAGGVVKTIGAYNADEFQSQMLEQQAQYGLAKAAQTGAQLSQRLSAQVGNIQASRAAMHDDPTSPTGAAITNWQEELGAENRGRAVTSIQAQAAMDEMGSQYEASAANMALLGGALGVGGTLFTGLGKLS